MVIIWDEKKNTKLKKTRNISFEQIEEIISQEKYIDVLKNASRPNQKTFVISINNYIYAVPFIKDKDSNIILKTAYPTIKLYKKYIR
jgi:uncharacterized DUF497 family protein